MGHMAEPPSKSRKLVQPASGDAAVEPAAGTVGAAPVASARRGGKGKAANARTAQIAGRKAGSSAPDTQPLTELPNLKMYQPVPVGPGVLLGLACGSPLAGRGGRVGRTARQLYRELGREATPEEIAEALGPGWNAARVQGTRKGTPGLPDLPDGEENR